MNDTYIELGERISQLRKKLEMSQQKLAELVGYESSTAISLIESGKRRVQVAELEKLARALNTSTHFLSTGKEPTADLGIALRAEKGLEREDIEKVVSFIDFIKSQRDAENRK